MDPTTIRRAKINQFDKHVEILEEEYIEKEIDVPDTKESSNSRQKSTVNRRREEYIQKEGKIKRTERAVPTARRDARGEQCLEETEVRPMTRNKDTESHQRVAAEQELKVAEKAREHQVEIEEEIEVEE